MFNGLKCEIKRFYDNIDPDSRVFLLDKCYLRLDYEEKIQMNKPSDQYGKVN
jgi:hypothetical protein